MTLDNYPAQAKRLASSVTRLRGWVGSDPARQPELADELVALTDVRLDAGAWAEAVTDAQEALALAGRLLAAHGGFGPYTPAADAARFVHAAVQLAALQAQLGLPEAASASLDTALAVIENLPSLDLITDSRTPLREAAARSAAGLASGDVAASNTAADAAIVALEVTPDVPELAAVRVLGAIADARWAAGRRPEALVWSWAAVERYRRSVDLGSPATINPARLARLADPLLPAVTAFSRRLAAQGDLAWAIALDREAMSTLSSLTGRAPETAAWADRATGELASRLLDAGRPRECLAAAAEVVAHGTSDAATLAAGRAHLALGDPTAALAVLEPLVVGGLSDGAVTETEALAAYAQALAATGQDASEIETAARQAQAAVPVPVAVTSWPAPAGPFATGFDPQRLTAATARVEREFTAVSAAARSQAAADEDAVRARAEQEFVAADAARLADEQRAAAAHAAEESRRAAERHAAARADQEQRRAAAAAERQETKRRREERLEAHRRETERREAAERRAELSAQLAATRDPAERERLELDLLALDLESLERDEAAASGPTQPGPVSELRAGSATGAPEDVLVTAEPASSPPRNPATAADGVPSMGDAEVPVETEEQPANGVPRMGDAATPVETEGLSAAPAAPVSPPQTFDPEGPTDAETADHGAPVAVERKPHRDDVPAADPLAAARIARDEARASGDRRALRKATEDLVEALRPVALAEPASHGADFVAILRELASLRLRTGDWLASRAPAGEAKALAKQWGLR